MLLMKQWRPKIMPSLLDLCKRNFTYDTSIEHKVYALKWLDEHYVELRRYFETGNINPIFRRYDFVDYVRITYKTWTHVQRAKELP